MSNVGRIPEIEWVGGVDDFGYPPFPGPVATEAVGVGVDGEEVLDP